MFLCYIKVLASFVFDLGMDFHKVLQNSLLCSAHIYTVHFLLLKLGGIGVYLYSDRMQYMCLRKYLTGFVYLWVFQSLPTPFRNCFHLSLLC